MIPVHQRTSRRVQFFDDHGHRLIGILDAPDSEPIGTAVYSSCFTCGKDLKAAARIGRKLAEQGIAILRYDFRGLGESEGVFAETNFSTNQGDLRKACQFMEESGLAPQLLIGHSLGGATSLSIAHEFPSVKGVCALAAPSDTAHLAANLAGRNPALETMGEGSVEIGGREFLMREQLLDDLRTHSIERAVRELTLPLLIMHSPQDETLSFEHALRLWEWAGGPRSMITLENSDHLFLANPAEVEFVAGTITLWAKRFVFHWN